MLIGAEDEPVAETRSTNIQGSTHEVAMVQYSHKGGGEGKEKGKKAMAHACELQMDGLPMA